MSKVYQINEMKDKLYPIFADFPVYRAILFGSYAKGLADGRSDIDIVIDSRGKLHGIHFYSLLEDIAMALDKRIDMFEISEIRPDSSLMDEITKNGVIIYEELQQEGNPIQPAMREDYTEWQKGLFDGMSVAEIGNAAAQYCKENPRS